MSGRPIRFGTDGVRGPAGSWPLDVEGMQTIGLALGEHVCEGEQGRRVLVARDTRESGPLLSTALVGGLVAGGAEVVDLGVYPTGALSLAVSQQGAAAGVMVTASHNPWPDNGVKVMGPGGGKLLDQAALEARFGRASGRPGGSIHDPMAAPDPWSTAFEDLDLHGVHVLIDAAHGAGAGWAPRVLRALGATVTERGCAPDGRNINEGVGALHPPTLDDLGEADLAICLDGDADRVLVVDRAHGLLDGDDVLWMLRDAVSGPLVGTIMSNGGLGAALGDRLVRAAVGDRHVAARMVETGATLGAEPSGHVLFTDGWPTGDGLYSALRLLRACADTHGRPRLPLPADGWTRWPQAQQSFRYAGARPSISGLASIPGAEAAGHRVVCRYSGTEPKVRVLVEGMATGADSPAAWCARIVAELSERA